jgi:DNA-binding winged helix-turn-helix (wHTH) protein
LENVFRFAQFEVDRDRYQLRCQNRVIKVERIPMELLFLLLEQRGKLVDRTQIATRLWRDVSFLDTERSINTAVRKLRKALGDHPKHPQFLETVVGKGYRFILPLLPAREDAAYLVESGLFGVHGNNGNTNEIRLEHFSVESDGPKPVLTCEVTVGKIALGRLPLLELEVPEDLTLPIRPEDRSILKLHGIRVALTDRALQAFRAFSIFALQSGLRSRKTDFLPHSERSPEETHGTLQDKHPVQNRF